jgi:tRNA dimethylallyltransferase
MGSQPDQTPLIVIVGETASGKSALALALATQFNGEIIAADSRTIYKDLSIGTAKPTPDEQRLVPHHLLDAVTPDQSFSVAQFKTLANKAINDIGARGKIPFLVGGTGLYVDAVLYDFVFRDKPDEKLRQELSGLSVEELQERLLKNGIALPENARNPRHLIRALETGGASMERHDLRPNTLVLGLTIDREALREKITKRVDLMVGQGFIEEVRAAANKYGWEAPALQSTGYKAFRRYIEKDLSLDEAKALFVRNDLQLAKRQRTWFKRNADIHWICKKEEAVDLMTTFLNKSSIA